MVSVWTPLSIALSRLVHHLLPTAFRVRAAPGSSGGFASLGRGVAQRIEPHDQGRVRRRRTVGFIAGAVLLGAGCVGPARDATDYQKKAVATTEHVRSSVRTVQLAIEAARDDDAFGPYLSRVVSQAEDDASSALNGFESIQPPGADSDQLRDDVEKIASDAIDTLAEARIASRRNDIATLIELHDKVAAAGDGLDQFGEEHHA